MVLELETYMLEQQGLPIDFAGINAPDEIIQDKRVFGLPDGAQDKLLGSMFGDSDVSSVEFKSEI